MSERTDVLDDLSWPDLQKVAAANDVTATKKREILAGLRALDEIKGLPDPSESGAEGAPDEAAENETRKKLDGNRIERRRPITDVVERKYWVDPFSGLKVRDGSPVCEQSGVHRDGDEAYLIVPSWG